MFDFFAKLAVKLDTGETIPCTSMDDAEHRATYHIVYKRGESADILRNGKVVRTVRRGD